MFHPGARVCRVDIMEKGVSGWGSDGMNGKS